MLRLRDRNGCRDAAAVCQRLLGERRRHHPHRLLLLLLLLPVYPAAAAERGGPAALRLDALVYPDGDQHLKAVRRQWKVSERSRKGEENAVEGQGKAVREGSRRSRQAASHGDGGDDPAEEQQRGADPCVLFRRRRATD